jgi:Spy/CpxP family protein refolding chaperone
MLQTECTKLKCVRWNGSFLGKSVLVAAVFLFLLAASRLVGSQSNSSSAPATPHPASPPASAKVNALPLDGLKFTDDQKTKIAHIRQNADLRRESIIKNDELTEDRKETIIQRLHRMETSEIFRVLTPDQRKEVQKRITDQRAAAQQEAQHQSKQAVPAPSAVAPPTPAAN